MVEGSRSIIEVGCGSSPLLGMLPGKVTGIDRDLDKLAYQRTRCNGNIELIRCNLGVDEYPELPIVDSVVCNSLLEHLPNPEGTIKWISSLVDKGGRVVLTVPDYSSKLTSLVERLYGKLMPKSYAEDHCYQFTEKELDDICKCYGLSLVSRHKVFTDMVCLYKKN
jgi:SAM-dependent methyltransferase